MHTTRLQSLSNNMSELCKDLSPNFVLCHFWIFRKTYSVLGIEPGSLVRMNTQAYHYTVIA